MEDLTLLRKQKNDIFNIIIVENFDPKKFDLEVEEESDPEGRFEDKKFSVIRFRGTDYYYKFDYIFAPNKIFVSYAPGYSKRQELYPEDCIDGWKSHKGHFRNWLKYLAREVNEPDLWEEMLNAYKSTGSDQFKEIGNEKFSKTEIKQIEKGFEQVFAFLKNNQKLSKSEFQFLEEQIQYLVEASKRLGKKDWKNIFISAFIQIIITIGLQPDMVNAVKKILASAFQGIVQIFPLLHPMLK